MAAKLSKRTARAVDIAVTSVFHFYAFSLKIESINNFCLYSVVSVTMYYVISDMTCAKHRGWNSRWHRKIAAVLNGVTYPQKHDIPVRHDQLKLTLFGRCG